MVTIMVVTMIIMSKGKVTYTGLKMLETIITEAFFLSGFTFTNIHNSQRTTGEGGGYLF